MYNIQDNFLPIETFKQLKDMITGTHFPWYYNKSINSEYTDKQSSLNTCYFTHILFFKDKIRSDYYKLFLPIFDRLNYKKMIRVKLNCYPRLQNLEIHKPHQDFDFEHKGCIVYFNTNNGYTILEDETRIESIENRALFFDSSKPHSSTNCTDMNARFNININYI